MSNIFFYEDGQENIYNEKGERIYDPMEIVLTEINDPNIVLETITSKKQYLENKSPEKIKQKIAKPPKAKKEDNNKSTVYNLYNDNQRINFISKMIDLPLGSRKAAKVARELGINVRTAQRWWSHYLETEELPFKKTTRITGRHSQFTEEPQRFVKQMVVDNPQTTVDEVLENVTSEFKDLTISRTQLHHHMKNTLNLTVKYPTFETIARNDPDNLESRFQWFQLYKDTDLDYLKNCVFIDEAGFHISMKNNWAWSEKGTQAIVKTPQTRSISHTIIGAICATSILHVVLRKPPPRTSKGKATKTQKSNKGKKRVVDCMEMDEEEKAPPKGTTTAHYIKFINELLDIMDEDKNMKSYYLVMDNASIHKSKPMQRKIESRGYRVVYLPPYSPELNPIEQFWHLVKHRLKKEKLLENETLSNRITDACNQVAISDLESIIGHSKRQIIKCYNKEPF